MYVYVYVYIVVVQCGKHETYINVKRYDDIERERGFQYISDDNISTL